MQLILANEKAEVIICHFWQYNYNVYICRLFLALAIRSFVIIIIDLIYKFVSFNSLHEFIDWDFYHLVLLKEQKIETIPNHFYRPFIFILDVC
jgi:hypothetical protein